MLKPIYGRMRLTKRPNATVSNQRAFLHIGNNFLITSFHKNGPSKRLTIAKTTRKVLNDFGSDDDNNNNPNGAKV